MSRDYAKKKASTKKTTAQARKNPPKRQAVEVPRLKFFLLGVFATIAVQVAYYVYTNSSKVEDSVEQVKTAVIAKEKKPNKPDITFYQTLPDAKVQVDAKPAPLKQQKPYTNVLQAGSFKNIEDAEQRRVEILLLGLEAKIESSENSSGTLWHRLIVGPFASRAELNQARSKLENNRMDTLLLQR